MGVTKISAHLLLDEAAQRPFRGSVLTLGRQDIHLDRHSLDEIARERRVSLRPSASNGGGAMRMNDVEFLEALGFDSVASMDASEYQGATVCGDLNTPVDPRLAGQYDVVLEQGTLEHVFHLPMALQNIHALLKVGGRMIFLLPCSNHVDHGYYSFSPVLFHDYLTENRYRIDDLSMITFDGDWYHATYKLYSYDPRMPFHAIGSAHGFDREHVTVGLWGVATKTAETTGDKIPTQFHYRELAWQKRQFTEDRPPPPRYLPGPLQKVREAVGRIPVVERLGRTEMAAKWRGWARRRFVIPAMFPEPDRVIRC